MESSITRCTYSRPRSCPRVQAEMSGRPSWIKATFMGFPSPPDTTFVMRPGFLSRGVSFTSMGSASCWSSISSQTLESAWRISLADLPRRAAYP